MQPAMQSAYYPDQLLLWHSPRHSSCYYEKGKERVGNRKGGEEVWEGVREKKGLGWRGEGPG